VGQLRTAKTRELDFGRGKINGSNNALEATLVP
jgi:hypothetical protein